MIAGLISGQAAPEALADLAPGRLKAKHDALVSALTGHVGDHQRFLLDKLLDHVDYLDRTIAATDVEIARRVDTHQALIALLDTIPGIDRRTAEAILAEIGVDLSRFPDADHLAAWAGLAPGQNESAGKRRRSGTRPGNVALRMALVLAAWAATHTKATFLAALYSRWVKRMPKKKALVALAHRILIIVYHVMTTAEPYQELGVTYHDERQRTQIVHRAIRHLERLGLHVTVDPLQPESAVP